jgi:hypothetical protein
MIPVYREVISTTTPLAARTPEIDFAIVLSRTIGALNNDPAQLRNVVYQLARIKLQEEAAQRNPAVDPRETRQLTLALESAIDRVETICSKHDNPRVLRSGTNSSAADGPARAIHPREGLSNQLPVFWTRATGMSPRVARSWRWPGSGPLLRTAILVSVVIAIGMVLDRHFALFGRFAPAPAALAVQNNKMPTPTQTVQASGQDLEPTSKRVPSSAGFPLPTVYGIYALNGGHLHELEPLVGRVPDQRVFMSTPIRTPSRTTLPDGRMAFIIYRRDAANSAPDRVTVRVIARVMRAMTFDTTGQDKTTDIEDSWTIRNVSYDFRVAPASEGSEMLMIWPENDDFVLPAGRYGLVIKGQAYDFTVAGPITEAAQCLEGVKASNGMFYSECRQPNEKRL